MYNLRILFVKKFLSFWFISIYFHFFSFIYYNLFSFWIWKRSFKTSSFRSSSRQSGIIKPCSPLLIHSILLVYKLLRGPAFKKFLIMRFTSKLKSLGVLLVLCNSWHYGIKFTYAWDISRPMKWKLFWLNINFYFYFKPTSNNVGI